MVLEAFCFWGLSVFECDVHLSVIMCRKFVNMTSYKLLMGIHQIYNFGTVRYKDELMRF